MFFAIILIIYNLQTLNFLFTLTYASHSWCQYVMLEAVLQSDLLSPHDHTAEVNCICRDFLSDT